MRFGAYLDGAITESPMVIFKHHPLPSAKCHPHSCKEIDNNFLY